MERDGWWFVSPSLVVVALGMWGASRGGLWGWPVLVVGFLAVLAFALFFRDPRRRSPHDPDAVVATADGRVVVVAPQPDGSTQIDTFLSVWNVHVNRAPVAGAVTASEYHPGRFLVAYAPEAATENERHDLIIAGDLGDVRSAQIAGILARRVICRAHLGDRLAQGQKIGLIRFGSRASVIVPPGCAPVIALGDRVRAGESVIARRVTHA